MLISIQYISSCQKDLKGASPYGLLSVWVHFKNGRAYYNRKEMKR